MNAHTLRVFRNGIAQDYRLSAGKPIKITVQAHEKYQLLNQHGALIIEPHTQIVGQDLWVFDKHNQALFNLENYQLFQIISDDLTLMQMNASLAVGGSNGTSMPLMPTHVAHTAAVAPAAESATISTTTVSTGVATHSGMPFGLKLGLGVLGVGLLGAAAAGAGGGADDSSDSNSNNANNSNPNPPTNPNNPTQPTTPATPAPTLKFNPITADNVLNVSESATTVTISGSSTHAKAGDVLTLTVGKTSLTTTLAANGTFSVAVKGADLAQTSTISGSLKTKDSTGKTLTASATQAYQLNWQPEIELNHIAGDNVLTPSETKQAVTISGTSSNLANGSTIQINVMNGNTVVAQTSATTANGVFSVNVAGTVLAQGTEVVAKVNVSAPNGQTWSDSVNQQYTQKTIPTLTFDPITDHNEISVYELYSSPNITVTGKVVDAQAGDTVKLSVNQHTFSGSLNAQGVFSIAISSELLSEHNQITGSVLNSAGVAYSSNAVVHPYAVERLSRVYITEYSEDNLLGLDDHLEQPMIRISGSLDVNQLIPQLRAKGILQNIKIKIGDQTYAPVGLEYDANSKNYHFFLDVPRFDLQTGEAISYEVGYLREYEFFKKGLNAYDRYTFHAFPINFTNAITLSSDKNVLAGSKGAYTIGNLPTMTHTVSGYVDKHFVAGDVVQIHTYTASVDAQGKFSLEMAHRDLTNTPLSVKVVGKSSIGEAKILSIKNILEDNGNTSFVAGNHHATNDTRGIVSKDKLPYFINALDDFGQYTQLNYNFGFLDKHKVGEPIIVHVHVPTAAELADLQNYANFSLADYENHGFSIFNLYEFEELVTSNPIAFSQQDIEIIFEALNNISPYINLKFHQVDNAKDADINFYLTDFSKIGREGAAGYAFFGGNVYLDQAEYANGYSLKDNDGLHTVLHEVLHTLGLKHPHLEDGEDPNLVAHLSEAKDSSSVTIMSYTPDDYNNQIAPHLYDLATLHYLYGVNPEMRKNNDTYTFANYNPASIDGDIYIWDGGGSDTFDASKETQGVNVNLTPGSWIYADRNNTDTSSFGLIGKTEVKFHDYRDGKLNPEVKTGDLFTYDYEHTDGVSFIGYGTQIENLLGSSFDDILTGNAAANIIQGGKGNDTLDGKSGADNLFGGTGNDVLMGGEGNDILTGGLGKDTLTGGTGTDRFVFDSTLGGDNVDIITDFTVGEDLLLLSNNIFFSEAYRSDKVFTDFFHYDKNTGVVSFDVDGKYSYADFVPFAILPANLDIQPNSFASY